MAGQSPRQLLYHISNCGSETWCSYNLSYSQHINLHLHITDFAIYGKALSVKLKDYHTHCLPYNCQYTVVQYITIILLAIDSMVTKNLPLASKGFHATFKSVANLSNLGPELPPYFIHFLKCQIHTISITLYNTIIQVLSHSLKAHSTYLWYPSKIASLSLNFYWACSIQVNQTIPNNLCNLSTFKLYVWWL